MPSSSSNGSGPRYAPEDPTLPAPWKGLVDGSTGYLYYWNPVTNVTQYEKPVKEKLPGPPPLPPPPGKPALVSSSVHKRGAHDDDHHHHNDDRSRNHKYQSNRPSSSYSHQRSGDIGQTHGNDTLSSKTSTRAHGSSDAAGGLSSEAYRHQHEISIVGDDVPPPYMTFDSTGFPSEILKEVHRAGFAVPTPIQAQSWPIALRSRDVVAIAKTGSGKTLGYLLPGFIHLKNLHNNPKMGPTVLVLAPTRELATQIQEEAVKFGWSSNISCTCVYGGAPKGPQLRDLDRGVDVVVATPGRLNDILEMRRINLRQVSYLVLDEADRMLDMGFEPQIRKIVKEIPHRRQTLMYTATWPKEVRKIAADLLVHPVQVNIGNIDELVANKAITQYVEVIRPIEKQRRLEQILRSQEPGSKVIIFCTTKRVCDQLARTLNRQFSAAAIHGDKNQTERDRVLGHFRTGRSPILVATDVAARGLDIKDIRVVINYDFPTGVEDYVHRIGRTGRAGATGVSYTFFSDQDSKYARELVKILEGAGQRVPPELRDMVSFGGGKSRRWGSGARDRGRPNGINHGDSVFDVRGGRGLPTGRSDNERGVYRAARDSHDRYDLERSKDKPELDKRIRQELKAISRSSARSRSNSRSLSPRAQARGHLDLKAISRGSIRSRSNSHSLSPRADIRGHQDSKRISKGSARSRSNSRSLSPRAEVSGHQDMKAISRGTAVSQSNSRNLSPSNVRGLRNTKAISGGRVPSRSKSRSLSPETNARGRRDTTAVSGGGFHTRSRSRSLSPIADARGYQDKKSTFRSRVRSGSLSRSSSPRLELKGRQDTKVIVRGRVRSRSNSRSLSPRAEARGHRDTKAISKSRVRNRSKDRNLSPSPKRARVSGRRSRSRSRSITEQRQSTVLKKKGSMASNDTCDQRKLSTASYDDGEIRDDQLGRSPSARNERSRSPIQSRHTQPDWLCSPKKVRSRSPYLDNGRRGGSHSPGHWRQQSPNSANGAAGSLIGERVQTERLADDDEEEEGMIHPDEEEGMIHPDEDIPTAVR